MTLKSTSTKALISAAVVVIVVVGVLWKYWDYVVNPWTRNGQVMAQVIQITPRVTGWIVDLPIVDNQFVKKGDLLFQIDPRTYESTLAGMKGMLAETEDEIDALTAQVHATAATIKQYEAEIDYAVQKVKGKQARLDELMALQQPISLAKNQALVGQMLPVLIEGHGDGVSVGRSYRDAPEIDGLVIVPGELPLGELPGLLQDAGGSALLAAASCGHRFDLCDWGPDILTSIRHR